MDWFRVSYYVTVAFLTFIMVVAGLFLFEQTTDKERAKIALYLIAFAYCFLSSLFYLFKEFQ